MGMGWPQQLDVRLDGKLLKRFIVGGKAPGTPAASSYAGDGEPGFAGAPEWETSMQLTGDAGLEVRVPVTAGTRVVGVCPSCARCGNRKGCRNRCSVAGSHQRSGLHGLCSSRRGRHRRPASHRPGSAEDGEPQSDLRVRRNLRPTSPARIAFSRAWRGLPIAGPSRGRTATR